MVVVVIIGAWWAYSGKAPSLSDLGIQGQYSASPSPVAGVVKKPVAKQSTAPTSTQNYTQLVKQYEGKRIQFDERCQAFPQSPTYKNGTSIMIDNRSASARSVTVGDTKYNLSAYGYKIITLSSSSLPKELFLSCGSAVNVGKILLQAQILP